MIIGAISGITDRSFRNSHVVFQEMGQPSAAKDSRINEKCSPTPTPPSGPERGRLAILPNELIPTVLTRLDSRSLFCVAQVSRRFSELSTVRRLSMAMVVPMIMFLLFNIAVDLGRCKSPFRTMSGMRAGIMPVRIPVKVAFSQS
ncbi:hypothetical protein DFH08DRAFT_957593 [Mycena albidolilacea]|uniref:F-box domain-containing protein n=1 Tax=Mycena albidolilacea TaxID=1033008 RepID=A0AAD7A7F2_9AGAR|nr:hypothetical protein DFH08DRAFT_957593 [Mycena albidolilacea]